MELVWIVVILLFLTSIRAQEECLAANSHVDSFRDSIRSRSWQCARRFAESQITGGTIASSLVTVLENEQRLLVDEIQKLRSFLSSASSSMSKISPSFQWAQSPDDILLNVKFSHKIDAPATLNVEPTNVTVTADGLSLTATDGKKIFGLELEFYGQVVPENSTWSLASVGRMTFQLPKVDAPSKWPKLLKSTHKKISNMHLWWEIHEKHSDSLEELEASQKRAAKKLAEQTNESGVDNLASQETPNTAEVANSTTGSTTSENSESKKKGSQTKKTPEEKKLAEELARLDEEGRKRKKDVDSKAREEKMAIDRDIAEKKKLLQDKLTQENKNDSSNLSESNPMEVSSIE